MPVVMVIKGDHSNHLEKKACVAICLGKVVFIK